VEKPDKNENYLLKVRKLKVPVILLMNKIDLIEEKQLNELVDHWHDLLPQADILPVSALEKTNIGFLFDKIIDLLPEGPAFYPKDSLTDKSERFIASEIIREKIFLNYQKEIPYSVEVGVESFKEEPEIVRIRANIYVLRQSQKGIIIGHKGSALKKVGTDARKDIEGFLNKKVFLELYVRVNQDWRDKPSKLKNLGYDNL
jgi:GTP-binding protein Era